MRTVFRLVFAMLVLAAVIVALRTFAVTTYKVTSAGMENGLHRGESVLVDRWIYGLRMPLEDLFGYHRLKERAVERGDVLVFDAPAVGTADGDVLIGRCVAVPGDVVYLDSLFVNADVEHRLAADAMPLYLPQMGGYVEVQPWNVMLLRNTLALHEGKHADVRGDTLLVNGKPVRFAKLSHEYHWIASDNPADLSGSKIFGLVPKSLLIGKACRVWLTKDIGRFLKEVE